MKKFLLNLALTLTLLTSGAYAANIKVISLEDFSTENPSTTYTVKTIQPEFLNKKILLETGTVISGSIIKIHEPKRGKRDGYFEFKPISAICNGTTTDLLDSKVFAIVKGYEPLNPKDLVISGGKTAAGFFVKGASEGISLVQGIAQNEEGNRLKSGVKKVYKDSPLSYIEAGKELNVKAGDVLVLRIKKLK